jgi:hypothetical protein
MINVATPAASMYQAIGVSGRFSLTPTTIAMTDDQPMIGQITTFAISVGRQKYRTLRGTPAVR